MANSTPVKNDGSDLAAYLADRDAACPFCQESLRGVTQATCPSCGKEITLALLKNTKQAGVGVWIWIVRALALVSFSVAVYLAFNVLPAGCGEGGGCSEVLSSRWSKLFGVPVSVPAAVVYAGIIIATFFITPGKRDTTRRDAWLILFVLALFAGLGSLWFIGLQLFEIKAICPYCMVDHAGGLIVSIFLITRAPLSARHSHLKPPQATLAGLLTVAVFGCFVGLQIRYPAPRGTIEITNHVDPDNGQRPAVKDLPTKDVLSKDSKGNNASAVRIRAIKDPSEVDPENEIWLKLTSGPPPAGYVALPRREFPVRGTYDAKHLFVVMVDYTCPHCKDLHDHLDAMFKRYGEEQISFLILPMPLDAQCNPSVRETHHRHLDACELATTALTVWRADPSKFAAFDDWLFALPTGARKKIDALKQAVEVLGRDRYKEVEQDPWVAQQVQTDVSLYGLSNTTTNRRIPRLLYKDLTISGPADAAQLFKLLEEHVGLTPLNK